MKRSAGLVVYRQGKSGATEVLLVHPGGPFWSGKDEHAWSIPKGEYEDDDDAMETAMREFREELGMDPPRPPWMSLGEVRQPSRKVVTAWAVKGDLDIDDVRSNTFEMEWPRGSGRIAEFPEIDKASWFNLATARTKLHKGQVQIVDRLIAGLKEQGERVNEGTSSTQQSLFDA